MEATLEARRVLSSDPRWLALDKPAGLPTLAPEAPLGDAHRLALRWLARDGEAPGYLGQLEPLDRDASGVLLFSRERTLNAALVRALSTAERTYSVLVAADSVPRREGHFRGLGNHLPELHLRVTEQLGERVRLELTLRGVTKGVRAWLQHLHLEALSALHLGSLTLLDDALGPAVTFTAPLPWAQREEARPALWTGSVLADRFEESLLRRGAVAQPDTSAWRLVHREGDGVPGVAVDVYGEHALVHFYDALPEGEREAVLDAVHALGVKGVYVRFRPKQASVLGDTRRDDVAPALPVRGEAAPDEFAVRELGLEYLVRLSDGMSTGLFLDQRENRRRVRALCAATPALSVLNLFCYTAPFTVAAAAGGCTRSLSVDVSAPALARAQANLERNGLAAAGHEFVHADVFGWLEGARARGDRFDLVVLDPPSYSSTREGPRFSAESDYGKLLDKVLPVLAHGGRLLACCNHQGVSKGRLRRALLASLDRAQRPSLALRELPDPVDFPPAAGDECHLKSLLAELS